MHKLHIAFALPALLLAATFGHAQSSVDQVSNTADKVGNTIDKVGGLFKKKNKISQPTLTRQNLPPRATVLLLIQCMILYQEIRFYL